MQAVKLKKEINFFTPELLFNMEAWLSSTYHISITNIVYHSQQTLTHIYIVPVLHIIAVVFR